MMVLNSIVESSFKTGFVLMDCLAMIERYLVIRGLLKKQRPTPLQKSHPSKEFRILHLPVKPPGRAKPHTSPASSLPRTAPNGCT